MWYNTTYILQEIEDQDHRTINRSLDEPHVDNLSCTLIKSYQMDLYYSNVL